uniref:AB hydrolase-1 domain-containing protein n=1 Tax=Caenorhabditis tropicalis TaxID=1561998 RepID=A0A1I7T0W1_9PELO
MQKRFLSKITIRAPKLYEKLVKFETEKGNFVDLKAVYEDSLPTSSSQGTVIGFHGSPGSHKDFKYIRHRLDDMGIRFIGINYPGFKQTDAYPGQRFTNLERQRYSDAVLDELDIQGKIIIMGHSRGCENALITTTYRNPHGLVMINPTGLRIHKGSRPKGKLEGLNYMHKQLPKRVGDIILFNYEFSFLFFSIDCSSSSIKNCRIQIQDGQEAMAVIRTIQKCDLEKQMESILKLNEMSTKVMITFGGNDHLIEKEIIFEALQNYQGLKHFVSFYSNMTSLVAHARRVPRVELFVFV